MESAIVSLVFLTSSTCIMFLPNILTMIIGTAKLPAEKFANQEEPVDSVQDKSLVLNSADEIFAEIRQVH